MANKKLIIYSALAVGLVILALIAVGIDNYRKNNRRNSDKIGEHLLDFGVLSKVDKIKIGKSDYNVVLVKDKNQVWHLKDQSGYPVDAKKIADFFDSLLKTTIYDKTSKGDQTDSDFGLDIPTKVSMYSGEKSVLNLALGHNHTSGGKYAKLPDLEKDSIFLLSEQLIPNTDEDSWELKSLAKIDKNDVKSIEFFGHKTKPFLSVKREKKDDKFTLTKPLKTKQIKEGEINAIAGALSNLSYKKRVDNSNEEAKTAMLHPLKITYHLFDGRSYDILIGKLQIENKKKYFIKVMGKKGDQGLDTATEASLKQLNSIMNKWSFEAYEYLVNKINKSKKDLLEKKKKKETKKASVKKTETKAKPKK